MTGTLVGRDAEREQLRAALRSALAGHGTAVTISGEAGIGKTVLALDTAAEADAAGAARAMGAGWAGGGAPAFWPFNQVLRALAAQLDDDALRATMGLGAPYLAHLVPQLRVRLPEAGEPAELESEQARFTLFDAVLNFLIAVAERRPLVIVLDDLHAADAATLRLLDFVVRHLHASPILVIALYQELPGAEAGPLLAELSRCTTRVRLGGLRRDDVAGLVSLHAPEADAGALAGRIHALTGGNPFFAGEVVRLVAARGPDAPLQLPEGVRATIRRRLEPVPAEALETLEVAAVMGMAFRTTTLALATGVGGDALAAQLDAAVAAGVLAPVAVPGRHAFSHSLVRETLYADLAPSRRARLHGAVAAALEREYGEAADEHLAELGHHLLAAGDARAAAVAERAGRHELRRLGFEQAERHFARALEVVRGEDPLGERAGELLLAQGEAILRGGRAAEAREVLAEATRIARRLRHADLFARATLAMVPWGFNVRVADAELANLAREALALVGDGGDPALRARLLSTLARTTYWSEPLEARLALVEEAVALARAAGDARTLARVLGDAHIATWNPDGVERSLAWIDEMLALAERTGDRQLGLDGHSWRMALLLERGDVAGVDAAFALSSREARETREPRALALLRRHEASRALIAGDVELARRSLAESVELTNRLQADDLSVMLVGALAFAIAWHRDDLEPLLGAVRDFADQNPEFPAWRCALADSLARTGHEAEARRELAAVRGDAFGALPRDNLWLVGTALAAEAAHLLGDADAARELGVLLEPYSGRNVVTPDGLYFGPVDRLRALVAHTAGDGSASGLLGAARASAQRLGAAPVLEALERDAERMGAAPQAPAAPAPAPAAARAAALCREGDFWRVSFATEPFLLKDAKGLRHLARLLAQPDVPLHVLDLGAEGVAREERDGDDAGPLLDGEAKAQYRRRIEELEEEIEEADAFNDTERAARAREELAFVATELRAAVGLGGRDRKAASSAERARVNVTRQIRGAIERISGHDAALGRHLEATVRTGTFCEYRPEPDGPRWELSA